MSQSIRQRRALRQYVTIHEQRRNERATGQSVAPNWFRSILGLLQPGQRPGDSA